MSREYVEKRIKEALKLTGGNATKARQQVIAWTYEDSKLLQGLAQPHLTGIVAHAISRVVNKKDELEILPEPPQEPMDRSQEFGMEILKAIASGASARFGQEDIAPPVKKQPASQRHIDAIRQMVGKKNTDGKK
jgi:hypothetical protein